jgi:hypothetical protein
VQLFLTGLLGRVARKNAWHLAEAIGETDPQQGVQRLLKLGQVGRRCATRGSERVRSGAPGRRAERSAHR